jgi:alpha-galactosidase
LIVGLADSAVSQLSTGALMNMRTVTTFAAAMLAISTTLAQAEQVQLSALDLGNVSQGWGKPQADKNVREHPISVAGRKFEHGLGTHAPSRVVIDLKGGATRFRAVAGLDDEVKGQGGSVAFRVYGDGKTLFRTEVMKPGESANIDVDLTGMKTLVLAVTDAGDGLAFDNADWADAVIEYTGQRPETTQTPVEPAVILTPPPSPKPRINGAKVFGVRPGSPFLYTIAATGERTMAFEAEGLPAGLKLDANTGQITGSIEKKGEYTVKLRAVNSLGVAERPLKIVVGDTLTLVPFMGWNSWYCFLSKVTDADIRAAADAMVTSGLINHGYSYINIDDGWEIVPGSKDPQLGGPTRDAQGRINTNKKFPDMKALADYIHSKGMKFGIYSSPGPKTCARFEGSYGHEEQDAATYAEWGVDLLKYDWCSYGGVAPKKPSLADYKKPYEVMNAALVKQKRDILYSLCQYGMGDVWKWGAEVGGNCWRTTGDLGGTQDLAGNMFRIGFSQNGLEKYAGPGHWNDPDFLMIGYIAWRGSLRPTPMTPNEQYTHVTLWSLLAAPLVFSGDMTRLDAFTTSLLTNDEVLDVNLDPLGKQGRRVALRDELEVWAKELEDGTKAVGLFNRSEGEADVEVKWSDLGVKGKQIVRDLWRQKDVGTFDDGFTMKVGRRGAGMISVRPAGQ